MMNIQAIKQLPIVLTTFLAGASIASPAHAHDQDSGHWGAMRLAADGRICYSYMMHSADEAVNALTNIGCYGREVVFGQGWGAAYGGAGFAWGGFATTRAEAEAGAERACRNAGGEICQPMLVYYTSSDSPVYENAPPTVDNSWQPSRTYSPPDTSWDRSREIDERHYNEEFCGDPDGC